MLLLLLALPFATALVLATMRGASARSLAWVAAIAPLAGLALLALMTPAVLAGQVPALHLPWIPQVGLDLHLRLDGLAWMFAGMVLAIGALVVLYARYYLSPRDCTPRFFAFLLLFMGSMLGVVLAGNLLLLVVSWELTSISSFLLIGYWTQRRDARQGARMALAITGAGGLALLAGVLLIGRVVGSYDLDVVLASGDAIRASALYPAILALVLGGIFTKSAQFPLHFWLPHAMAAPTPVSAYLHSATMVKAGVFLLARLHPALSGTELFFYAVTITGATTLLVGAWHAIFQHDMKGVLAYSTISHLGLITLLFGLSTPMAVVAGLFHILNHATFKASLFMAAGIVDHECGTRDVRRLGNLRRYLPWTSALAVVASLAMAGVPLLNGFLSKEMFFAEALQVEAHDGMQWFVGITAVLAGVLGVAYSLRFVHESFFGEGPRDLSTMPHEPPTWMRVPVAVLVAACLAVGMLPALTIEPTLRAAAAATLGTPAPQFSLAVWHGLNVPLLMSAGGMLGGIALYFGLRRLLDLHAIVRGSLGRHVFRWNMEALHALAARFTARIANGRLQRSLLWLVLAAIAAGAAPFLSGAHAPLQWHAPQPMPLLGWLLWLVLVACTLYTLRQYRQRLLALVVLGGAGLVMSLTFVFLSAPDLALTQLLVEMVSLALLLLGLHYLPARSPPERKPGKRLRDAAVACAAGLGIGLLSYAVMTRAQGDPASVEMLARSLPEAHGRNVVNVILVDFRGFDTFGEITVFAIAALIVHALLRRARLAPEKLMHGPPVKLPVPGDLAQLMFPLTLTVSVFLFVRGHNAPGGGFIAGLVLAVPLLIQYVIQGAASVESRFGFDYVRCIGTGLVVAALGGAGSLLFHLPFLTSGYVGLDLPLLGELPLASAMVFDTGVYLVVFGGAMLILSMLGTIRPSRTRVARLGIVAPGSRSTLTGEAP